MIRITRQLPRGNLTFTDPTQYKQIELTEEEFLHLITTLKLTKMQDNIICELCRTSLDKLKELL